MATKRRSMKRHSTKQRYQVEAGRQIYFDGKPFISIGREGDTQPSDADSVTYSIAACLNKAKVRRGKHGIKKWKV